MSPEHRSRAPGIGFCKQLPRGEVKGSGSGLRASAGLAPNQGRERVNGGDRGGGSPAWWEAAVERQRGAEL